MIGIRPEYDIVCGEYGCRYWDKKKGFITAPRTRQSNELKRLRMHGNPDELLTPIEE